MTFDFQQFFDRNGVEYITSGKNVKHGNINVHCPWCGVTDPSHHLGVNVTTGQWGCWRDSRHRGVRPERLIVALTRLTWEEAKVLVESGQATEVGFEGLKERAAKLFQAVVEPPSKGGKWPFIPVKFDEGIRKIHPRNGTFDKRFIEYLTKRGFHNPMKVVRRYNLRCCMSGRWRHRLIFPFTMGGKMLGWTGRAIVPAEERYLSAPDSDVVKKLVYGYDDALKGGRLLAVVEGPIDRVKIDYYGRRVAVRAVSTLGVNVSDEQVGLIMRLAQRFDMVAVCADANALTQAALLCRRLPQCNARLLTPPRGVEDPGAMHRKLVPTMFEHLL
jgi:hypothetical protein